MSPSLADRSGQSAIRRRGGATETYPLVSEWNGRRWSTTVGKGFGKHWGALAGVSGDLWVTGVRNRKPVLHHFAGQRWTTEFRDVTFGESQGSDAIWMREGSELVRIGRQGQETRLELPPSVEPDAFGDRTPFAADARGRVWVDDGSGSVSRAHFWDGSRWSASRYPDGVWLHFAMATRSPNDVWAVGNELSHWNGRRWTKVVSQGESQVLYDIDLLADKVLTVGQDWSRLNRHGVIVEWDGKRWHTSYHGRRSVSNRGCPACDISTVESFEGVTFASGREAWAVGFGDAGNDTRGVDAPEALARDRVVDLKGLFQTSPDQPGTKDQGTGMVARWKPEGLHAWRRRLRDLRREVDGTGLRTWRTTTASVTRAHRARRMGRRSLIRARATGRAQPHAYVRASAARSSA